MSQRRLSSPSPKKKKRIHVAAAGAAPPPADTGNRCPLGSQCLFYPRTFGNKYRHTAQQAKDCTRAACN